MVGKYRPCQGDIVKVQFDPSLGHEQKGDRPALVISNDILSKTSPFVWLVPISHGNYPHPLHVTLDQRTQMDGTLYVEQPLAVDYMYRSLSFVEKVPDDVLATVLYNVRQIAT